MKIYKLRQIKKYVTLSRGYRNTKKVKLMCILTVYNLFSEEPGKT